jgi:hypothetical protein
MGIGTKAPISYEDVTRAQCWMQPDDLGEIMRAQGSCQHLQYYAGASMEQRQDVGHGEPTPRELFARLAKMLLQGGGIWHGKAGTIGPKGAMAQPAALIKRLGLYSVTD